MPIKIGFTRCFGRLHWLVKSIHILQGLIFMSHVTFSRKEIKILNLTSTEIFKLCAFFPLIKVVSEFQQILFSKVWALKAIVCLYLQQREELMLQLQTELQTLFPVILYYFFISLIKQIQYSVWSLKSKINFRILSPFHAQTVSPARSLQDFTGSQHLNRPLFVKNKCTHCQSQNSWITLYGFYQEGQTRWQMSLGFPNSLAVTAKCIYLEGHHLKFFSQVGFVCLV